jgi:hypothetical protein
MAKKKVTKKRKVSARVRKADQSIGVEFHSWTFFLFLLFVLVTTLILVAQRMGYKFF